MKTKKVFTTAPLPFVGQKRKFLKQFKPALMGYSPTAIYVDLFGGSGLLSHTTKAVYPNATVVYNDYDNYRERLANIAKTNTLLADLRVILKDAPDNKRIVGITQTKVFERLEQADKDGYVDWLTISCSLLFSMKYVLNFEDMKKQALYNTIKQTDYDATGYLDGLKVVSKDYKALFDEYKHLPNVVFLVDPPYLSTDVSTYKNCWQMKDYLDVLQVLEGTNYFYFTSNKSSIVELCEWIETRTVAKNPFANAKIETMNASINYISSYTDIMLYKKNE
jgi:hypothetical protein